jgi:DNA-binding NarL/FixJ family response regulator
MSGPGAGPADPSQAPESAPAQTVLVVDDHRSFAEMLVAALDGLPGLRCVGSAYNAADGIALAASLQPDIIVMDIQMPRQDGLAATTAIRKVVPSAVVAVVTAHTSPEWIARAAQAGASAFIPKNGSLEELIGILRRIHADQMVVAPSAYLTPPAAPAEQLPDLTQRELDVLRLLAAGTPIKELAPALGLAVSTCRTYIKTLRQKLGASSQLDAVLKARERGLLDGDPAP